MSIRTADLVTILGMAVVTYATRAGGMWLMNRVRPSPPVEAWLRHLPGAILVALVAPSALTGGLPTLAGILATVLVMGRSKNMILAMASGVGVVMLLRWLG